jgi:hypothetical protein
MEIQPLPFRAPIDQYQQQAVDLFEAYHAGDSEALRRIKQYHPRFRDEKIRWLPKKVSDSEVRAAELTLADAELVVAGFYDFRDWPALVEYVGAVTVDGSPVCEFETAVEAVVAGDAATLDRVLRERPELVRARSNRITPHDPPVHRATLLHYVAANGVESHRQKTPANAVQVAKILLNAGAEVDALAGMYGGACTTMSMLVSSSHPRQAGLQITLTETLLDFGAAIEGVGTSPWRSPLMTALAFGYLNTAEYLVKRGARVENIGTAAGLGRVEEVRRLLLTADAERRHRALALATQLGHAGVVRLLLDAGEDPNRYNPEGHHAHSTPLHQAALAGHSEVVRLLVEREARLDIEDTIFHGTPLGWAIHGEQIEVESYLRAHGAQ